MIDKGSLTATINSLTLEQIDTLIALEMGTRIYYINNF